jgi:hypothetical protein
MHTARLTHVNKQKVYRAGSMTPSPDAGAAFRVTASADGLRVGTALPCRLGSLFAAPTLPGSVRWVRAMHMCRYETRLREITVDADTTYVFHIRSWERVRDENDTHGMRAFWNTGITLTDWLARADAENLDGSEWEVIFAPSAVLAVRNVSAARLLSAVADPYDLHEVKQITRGWTRDDRNHRAAA